MPKRRLDLANNRRTRAAEAVAADPVQDVVVPPVSKKTAVRVPRPAGLRAVNLARWLSHYAHIKKFGNVKAKRCFFCAGGVNAILARPEKAEQLDDGPVVKSGGADQEGAASPAHSGPAS